MLFVSIDHRTVTFNVFMSVLEGLLNEVYCPSSLLVLGGDFNINFAHHSSHSIAVSNLIQSYGLHSHIAGMTRVCTGSQTQVDNFFSNIPLHRISSEVSITHLSLCTKAHSFGRYK